MERTTLMLHHALRRPLSMALLLLAVSCGRRVEPPAEGPPATAASFPTPLTYDVRVNTPRPIRSGVPVRLALSIVASDGTTPPLEPTYSASLHAIAVSRDLRWYAHLHSDAQPVGDVSLEMTFPADGDYVLFVYFRPAGGEIQSDRLPLLVGRSRRSGPISPLRPTPLVRDIRGYRIEMTAAPRPLRANVWEAFTFRMERGGKPVPNLGSEGALGHLAIVGEGAADFVFAHSTVEEAGGIRSAMHAPIHPPMPNEAMKPVGPEVTFHARFPRPGRYKLWAEFTPGGDDVMAEFVVEVTE